MDNFQNGMAALEAQLEGLKKEFMRLTSDQRTLSKHVDSIPGQIKEVREDVSFCLAFILLEDLEYYPSCSTAIDF